MNVLVACEFSGIVRDAFTRHGHYAVSCDLLPTESPGMHYEGDVTDILDNPWDLMVAHPPCTHLAVSGARWFRDKLGEQEVALSFVRLLMDAPIEHICVENPVSIISTRIRKPDQIIQPWQFGHDASKTTCLWLKNLPQLEPTEHIDPKYACKCGARFDYALGKYGCPNCCGDNVAKLVYGNQTPSGQNKLGPSPDRAKLRSATYPGIAEAMAEQWGRWILEDYYRQVEMILEGGQG
jgi:hypothetical protein